MLTNFFFILIILTGLGQLRSEDDCWEFENDFNETEVDIIISKMKSGDFAFVDAKIIELGLRSPIITDIVTDFYFNHTDNFYVLNDYASSSSNIEISFVIITELWNCMMQNPNIDHNELIELNNTIYQEIINRNNVTCEMKYKAKGLCEYAIQPKILLYAVKKLSLAIMNDKKDEYYELFEKASEMEEKLLNTILCKIIDFLYHRIPKEDIINRIFPHIKFSQRLVVLEQILKLYKIYSMDIHQIMTVAHYLSELTQQSDFNNLPAYRVKKLLLLIEKLPSLVSSLYFAENICLRNTKFDEYMYSSTNESMYDADRRYLFTDGSKNKQPEAMWHAIPYGNKKFEFLFKNEKYNEYMFASDFDTTASYGTRSIRYGPVGKFNYVFTWMPNPIFNKKFVWKIEISNNLVKIFNTNLNEYLCATYKTREKNERYVLTTKLDIRECFWVIESC